MNDETTTTYGELIRRARTAQGLTQRDLAGQLGCTDGFITKVEKGTMIPSTEFLARLANVLALSETDRTQLADAVVQARRTVADERHGKREESIRTTLRPAPPSPQEPMVDPVGSITELATELARNPELLALVQKLERSYRDPGKRVALQVALSMVENT